MISFLRYSHQNPVCTAFIPIRAKCSVHIIAFYLIPYKILDEQYRSLSSSLISFLYSPATSSLSGKNILSTLLSNALRLCSSLEIRQTKFQTHKSNKQSYSSALLMQRFQLVSLSPEIIYCFPIHTFLRMDVFQFKIQWKFPKFYELHSGKSYVHL